jgi:hypothetical protein
MRAGGGGWLDWTPPRSTIIGGSGSSSKTSDNGTSGGGRGDQTDLSHLFQAQEREMSRRENEHEREQKFDLLCTHVSNDQGQKQKNEFVDSC